MQYPTEKKHGLIISLIAKHAKRRGYTMRDAAVPLAVYPSQYNAFILAHLEVFIELNEVWLPWLKISQRTLKFSIQCWVVFSRCSSVWSGNQHLLKHQPCNQSIEWEYYDSTNKNGGGWLGYNMNIHEYVCLYASSSLTLENDPWSSVNRSWQWWFFISNCGCHYQRVFIAVNPSPEGIPARPPDDHPQIGGGKSRSGSLEKPISSKTKLVFGICLSHKKNIPSSPDTFLDLSTPFNTKLVHLFFDDFVWK